MSVPRVFVSSTYYDLKQVRFNIGDFIKNLGYEPVMHERSGVAYTQNEPMEQDCYHELVSCDIVVCIIGNHFGSKSADNDFSVTMNEIQTAIKNRRKVYIFIAKDVYIENRTYEHNKENGNFKSAYTDNPKIHEFISELKHNNRVLIESFETTDEIISTLKLQFAGLFQNLLVREASLSDFKASYDLQQSSDEIKAVIEELRAEKEELFKRFDGSVFACNYTIVILKKRLKIENITFFIKDDNGLDEFMALQGFTSVDVDDPFEDHRKYVRHGDPNDEILTMKKALFDADGKLKDIRSKKLVEDSISIETLWNDDCQLPF